MDHKTVRVDVCEYKICTPIQDMVSKTKSDRKSTSLGYFLVWGSGFLGFVWVFTL